MKRKKFFLTILFLFNCATISLGNAISDYDEYDRKFENLHIRYVTRSASGWLKLELTGLDPDYEYVQCISPVSGRLDNCPKNEVFDQIVPDMISVYESENEKGIWYLGESTALLSPYLKKQIFFKSALQFGPPLEAWIHEDGGEILVKFRKPRKDLPNVCYHEKIDYDQKSTHFLQDCSKLKSRSKFHPMRIVSLKSYLVVSIFESLSDPQEVFIAKINTDVIREREVSIHAMQGERKVRGPKYLAVLYPFAILFDVITFPVQFFLFYFGKSALG